MKPLNKIAWIFCSLLLLVGCTFLQKKQDKNALDKGLIFQSFLTKSGAKAHLVKIDSNQYQLEIVLPKKQKLAKFSQIITPSKHLVAINGSFFEKEGRPSGSLKIKGEWIRKPNIKRGVFAWNNGDKKPKFYFDRLGRSKGKITSSFHKNKWYQEADYIIAGAPLLVFNRKKINPAEEKTLETFLSRPYGRSAIGLHKDGKTLLVLFVEGGDLWTYRLGLQGGINISDLSDLMIKLGSQYALNLDGGYSSSLLVNKEILRYPLFRNIPERPIANVIAFKKKKKEV